MKTLLKRLSRFIDPSYWKIILNLNYWRTKNSLILIYNPSKVGSSSVYYSLKENLEWMPIAHLHYLNRDWINLFKEKGINNWKNNESKANEVYKLLTENKERRIKIITLVRDPVALELSSIFQGWKELFNINQVKDLKDEDILSHLNQKKFDWLQTWYTKEFKEFTGVDVTQEPFDPIKGFGIYAKGNMEMLLIKLEELDRVKDDALNEFLGVSNINWSRKNASSEKSDISENYARIKKSFGLEEEKLNSIYDNDFMKKFYSKEELLVFRAKWQLNR